MTVVASAPRARRAGLRAADARVGVAMVLPIVVIVVAIIVVPILWTFVLSFQEARYADVARNGLFNPLTLDNYVDAVTSAGFWRSLGTTVVYTVTTTIGSLVLGLVAALVLRRAFRGRAAVRAAMLLPYVAPVVASAFVWQVLLHPQYGFVNAVGTRLLGWEHPINFLGAAPQALVTVIAFEIWRYFPFAFLFLTAALTGLSREIEEAAVVDGATPLQRFWHVVLPQLLPTLAVLSVLRLVMTFNKFDDIYLLTGGAAGTQVAAVRVYDQLTGSSDIGAASANAAILAIVLAVGVIAYQRFVGRSER